MTELMTFLVIGGLVAAFFTWQTLLIITAGAMLIWAFTRLGKWWRESEKRVEDGILAVIARADEQHRQMMTGDETAGTYGEYLPPTGLR